MANGNGTNGNRFEWYKIFMGLIAAGSIMFSIGITYSKVNDTYAAIKEFRKELTDIYIENANMKKDIQFHDSRITALECERKPGG